MWLMKLFSHLRLLHTCAFLGAMGVLGSCLILLSCWEQGGAGESAKCEMGREPSIGFISNPVRDKERVTLYTTPFKPRRH